MSFISCPPAYSTPTPRTPVFFQNILTRKHHFKTEGIRLFINRVRRHETETIGARAKRACTVFITRMFNPVRHATTADVKGLIAIASVSKVALTSRIDRYDTHKTPVGGKEKLLVLLYCCTKTDQIRSARVKSAENFR